MRKVSVSPRKWYLGYGKWAGLRNLPAYFISMFNIHFMTACIYPICNFTKTHRVSNVCEYCLTVTMVTLMNRQAAVTADFSSHQLLLFVFSFRVTTVDLLPHSVTCKQASTMTDDGNPYQSMCRNNLTSGRRGSTFCIPSCKAKCSHCLLYWHTFVNSFVKEI